MDTFKFASHVKDEFCHTTNCSGLIVGIVRDWKVTGLTLT